MAITEVEDIKPNFLKRKKPTQGQFAEVFDSFSHQNRDFDKMGGGLKPHNPNRKYTQGEAMFIAGKIRTAKVNLPIGAYDANQWEDFTSNPASLGLTPWTPDEVIVYDEEALAQRTHRLAILEALADSQGIEPFVDPDWEEYWVVVVYTEGGYIPLYLGGGFVKKDRVYSYQLATAVPKGFYRCNRSDVGFDGGFKSTNFATELANGDWVLEAIGSPVGNTFDVPPELTDNASLGFIPMKSRWVDSTTQIEYLFISETDGEAFWFPLQGTIENPIGDLEVTGFASAKLSGRRDNLRYCVVGNLVTISGPIEFVISGLLASGGTISVPIPSPLNIATGGGDYGMVYSFRKNAFYNSGPATSVLGTIDTGILLITFGNSPSMGGTDKLDFTVSFQTDFSEF